MALQVEQAVDDGMGAQETLRLLRRAEAARPALPGSGRLMGQLHPVFRVAIVAVDRLRHQCPAGNSVAAQLVGHDLSGAGAVRPEQPPEESLGRLGVPARLQVHVDDVAVLIHCPPQVVPLPRDRDEYLVDEERVAEPWVSALESLREQRSELVAPQPHRLIAGIDTPLGEQILDIPMAEVEAMVEADRVPDNGRRESVPLVGDGARAAHGQ